MGQIKLRAAKKTDLPRLQALWQESFGARIGWDYFEEQAFVPDQVTTSLVLLDDGVIQSAVYFLPTYWYDEESDSYAPAPCLVGLSTAQGRRHKKYASWLVETACDFMVEKGAGAVWTMLDDDALELFFSMQGFWTIQNEGAFSVEQAALPAAAGKLYRVEPEDYDGAREALLRGKNHIVSGPLLSGIQRDMAERRGGGLFLLEVGGAVVCAIARRDGDRVEVCELLCPEELRLSALALLAQEMPAARYESAQGCGMLRLMNRYNKQLQQPSGNLGCGALL